MPELAEVAFASRFINEVCLGRFFRSPLVKSAVSKMKEIEWRSNKFTIESTARGKELQVILKDVSEKGADAPHTSQDDASSAADVEKKGQLTITFGFGMSGKFSFDRFDQIPKHAHLQIFTTDTPPSVLSFVDYRRFGKWNVGDYDLKNRGPDPVSAPREFRQKVLSELNSSVFNRAVCEAMMDQKYFNGIGNYLRAEILFRAKIPPFTEARSVLESLPLEHEIDVENPDLLDLCSLVPKEVFGLGKFFLGYNENSDNETYVPFRNWLRCYMKPGMKNLVDRQGRTMWFSGDPGPLVPPHQRSKHGSRKRKSKKAASDTEDDDDEDDTDAQSSRTAVESAVADEPVDRKPKRKAAPAPEASRHSVGGINLPRKLGQTKKAKTKKAKKTEIKVEIDGTADPVVDSKEGVMASTSVVKSEPQNEVSVKAKRGRAPKKAVANNIPAQTLETAVKQEVETVESQEATHKAQKKASKKGKKATGLSEEAIPSEADTQVGSRRSLRLKK
ncbi:hypothetical protein RvY_08991 [Ramazzottius varieornatus]|uniref:DNA-(apurinic or apyrimidinic site) lyase n=1 Tax=Ramazzottius varieornatus TaxID=947166 RepID=A0A1D1V7S9_RAMVA|nr:hypothetical protein RvY_08991 [Ramazzottius varieornatus]